MIKMNVSAETFDGDMVTETLWFHMNKVDLIELQQSEPGGFTDTLQAFMSRKSEDWTMSDKFKLFSFFRTMVDRPTARGRRTASDSGSPPRSSPTSRTASSTTSSS